MKRLSVAMAVIQVIMLSVVTKEISAQLFH